MIFDTPRLIARRFGPRDLEAFVSMRSDLAVARYQGWTDYSVEDGRDFIDGLAAREPGRPGWFQFALEEKETGAFVGDCGLDVHAHLPHLARVGYTIARPCWNRGLATEAVAALARFAFGRFALRSICASVDPDNVASCRVLVKAGFLEDGQFRHSVWFNGDWGDDIVYTKND